MTPTIEEIEQFNLKISKMGEFFLDIKNIPIDKINYIMKIWEDMKIDLREYNDIVSNYQAIHQFGTLSFIMSKFNVGYNTLVNNGYLVTLRERNLNEVLK